MATTNVVYDVLGVGFGPANIALAIALDECHQPLKVRFIEAQGQPGWQDGMLLDGSNIQNHPARDLVTPRNPRSRYSFINYLFEQGRLLEHLNLGLEFPLRKEYAQYIRWVAEHFSYCVDRNKRVESVRLVQVSRERLGFLVKSADQREYRARALVLASGRTPYVPKPFTSLKSPRVVHLTNYLPCMRAMTSQSAPTSIAVIGGSQSAVEIILDLASRFPGVRIVNYVRSFGLRLKDTSPFSEEAFLPAFTDYYYAASSASKQQLQDYVRYTNYSSVDSDVLNQLYRLIYEQRLDGCQRIFVKGNRRVTDAADEVTSVALEVEEVHTGARESVRFDLVVLATGFRDIGSGEQQERCPPLLKDVAHYFEVDAHGALKVNKDYSLLPVDEARGPLLYLNGLCESSHGIGDAGSFSLLSLRAASIAESLRCRLGHSAGVQPEVGSAAPSIAYERISGLNGAAVGTSRMEGESSLGGQIGGRS